MSNNILNRTKTEWIVLSDKDEIWVGQKHSYWLPLSELNEVRTAIKSYRGWKSAINGVLQAGGCDKDDIYNNRIRVLPVTTVLQVDENYKEVPVSNYFEVDLVIKQYVLTRKYNLIFSVDDVEIHKHTSGSKVSYMAHWQDVDKYGETHNYWDDIVASSDRKEDLLLKRDFYFSV